MPNKPQRFRDRIADFLRNDLWRLQPESLPRRRRFGLHLLRVGALIVKGFREDRCPTHASALTFISVMALVPFLVILFALAKAFGFEQASRLLLERTADMPVAFQEAVQNIIDTVESASAGTLGSIGTALFLWIAIKMLSNIEETFNLVWGVKTSRTLLDKVRNYVVIMVAAPILLILAYAGIPVIMGFAERLLWIGPFLRFGLQAVPVLIMTLAFGLFYMLLPNTRVRGGPALAGAFTAALLAALFHAAIIKLGVGVSRYNQIYGGLAAIPIFLFWVQMNWMILLMGAEAAFSVQNAGTYARERLAVVPSARARICLAFALMKQIAAAFESGCAPFSAATYGVEQKIPVRLINDVIHILSKNRLIAESADPPGGYTLLRDPADITARDIADAILDEGADPAELGLGDTVQTLETMTNEWSRALEKHALPRL